MLCVRHNQLETAEILINAECDVGIPNQACSVQQDVS